MSDLEVAQGLVAALEGQDFDGARAMMTDDFVFSGPVPEPVDGDSFLGLMRALTAGVPD